MFPVYEDRDIRLFPPLVVHEEVWPDDGGLGVGLVPHLRFENLCLVDERAVVA